MDHPTLAKTLRPLLLAAALSGAGSASAGLVGDTVDILYSLGDQTSLESFLVGAGPELSCPAPGIAICDFLNVPTQTVDFGDDFIRYQFVGDSATFTNVDPNRFDFLDLDYLGGITGITFSSNIAGFDASRLSFTADSVRVDMRDLTVSQTSFFQINLLPRSEVPEPGTGWLAGLAVLALWRRVRTR